MGVYGHIAAISDAILNSSAIGDYCIAKYGRGLQVIVDMNPQDPPSSDMCPWCMISSWPSTELGPVSEYSVKPIIIAVGIVPPDFDMACVAVQQFERTSGANGKMVYGNAKLAEELIDMVSVVVLEVNLPDNHMITKVIEDSNGWMHLPMQTSTGIFDISQAKTLGNWET